MTQFSIIPNKLSLRYPKNTHYIHYNRQKNHGRITKSTFRLVTQNFKRSEKQNILEDSLYELINPESGAFFRYQRLRRKNNYEHKILEVANFNKQLKLNSHQILKDGKFIIIRKANGKLISLQEFDSKSGACKVIKKINGQNSEQNFVIGNGPRQFKKGIKGELQKLASNSETCILRIQGYFAKIWKFIY